MFSADEMKSLSLLRKISYTLWKRDMVFKRKCKSNITENRKSYGESYVRSESRKQKDL